MLDVKSGPDRRSALYIMISSVGGWRRLFFIVGRLFVCGYFSLCGRILFGVLRIARLLRAWLFLALP